jgi:ATP-dependent helicase/nuclease subunit B
MVAGHPVAGHPVRVFNIPAGRPFLRTLADAILAGQVPGTGKGGAPDPLSLPKTLLLLPTRRACKAMQEAFLDASAGRALLLPRIRPIGDADEDESLITSGDEAWIGGTAAMDLAPAMDKIERHLILTSLVLRWIEQRGRALAGADEAAETRDILPGAETPAQASALARGLASLMDMVETEGADLTRLVDLAPAMFSEQWRQTVDFLNRHSGRQRQALARRPAQQTADAAGPAVAAQAASRSRDRGRRHRQHPRHRRADADRGRPALGRGGSGGAGSMP